MSQEARQKALNAVADVVEKNAEAFMELLTKEQGKPRGGAEWEILGSVYWLREIGRQSLPEEVVQETAERRVVTRFTALCTLKLGELCNGVLPAGVFNVASGGDELGKWMTAHSGIAKIAFTGRTEAGKHVMRSAAGTLKWITLEFGGNDPAIVRPDVDAKAIAPQLFRAAFANNAQFCNTTKPLHVHENVYDEVRAMPASAARLATVQGTEGSGCMAADARAIRGSRMPLIYPVFRVAEVSSIVRTRLISMSSAKARAVTANSGFAVVCSIERNSFAKELKAETLGSCASTRAMSGKPSRTGYGTVRPTRPAAWEEEVSVTIGCNRSR